MTWLRQAVHVAAKDARMAWYLLAAAVPLVLAQSFQLAISFDLLWSFLLVLLTVVLVAFVVQGDAAVRGDAFWVTLPLSPGAVFAAKLLFAAGLLALTLAGEAIVLARHAATGAQAVSQMVAVMRVEGQLLCIAVLIATLTRELRSFLLVLVLGLLAWGVGGALMAVSSMDRRPVGPPAWVWPILLVAGSLAIAGYQYHSGRRLRAALTATVFVGAVLILGAAFQPNPLTAPAFGARLAPGLRPDSVIAARLLVGPDREPDSHVSMRLVGGSRQLEYTLTAASLQVRRRDGSVGKVLLFPPTPVSGGTVVPDVPGARWVNVYTASLQYWAGLSGFGDENRAQGIPLRLDGELQAAQPSVGGRLPLRAGATLVNAGQRIHIVAASVDEDGVGIDVVVSRIVDDEQPFQRPQRVLYALLDRGHGLVYPLGQGRSSGGSSSLFGAGARVMSTHLQLAAFSKAQPAGPGPFELLLIGWRVVGSYHVSLPVGVRLREPPLASRAAAAAPQDPRAMTATVAPTPSR